MRFVSHCYILRKFASANFPFGTVVRMNRSRLSLSISSLVLVALCASSEVRASTPPSAACPASTMSDVVNQVNTPPSVSVNDGEEFTSSVNVSVVIQGPTMWNGTMGAAVRAELSNDGGFKTSTFFDLKDFKGTVQWALQSSREGTFTKIVYVRFWNCYGYVAHNSSTLTDDIILDNSVPTILSTELVASSSKGGVTVSRDAVTVARNSGLRLTIVGSDSISGVGSIEVRTSANAEPAVVALDGPYGPASIQAVKTKKVLTFKTSAKRLQVRCVDRAGNVSKWKTVTPK